MAIHALPKSVPTKLPEAKLHLDDIEELCDTLRFPNGEWTTSFVVDDKKCDSLEDLKELGKRTSTFRINVSATNRSRRLRISEFRSEVEISEYPENEELRWSMYAKVAAIFRKRRLGVRGKMGHLLAICLCAVAYLSMKNLPWHQLALLPLSMLVGVIIAKAITQPSIAVLAYSHKTWTLKSFLESEENRSKLIVAIVTALITLAVKAAYDRLVK